MEKLQQNVFSRYVVNIAQIVSEKKYLASDYSRSRALGRADGGNESTGGIQV